MYKIKVNKFIVEYGFYIYIFYEYWFISIYFFLVNGNFYKIRVFKMDMDEICKWIELVRIRLGVDIVRRIKNF